MDGLVKGLVQIIQVFQNHTVLSRPLLSQPGRSVFVALLFIVLVSCTPTDPTVSLLQHFVEQKLPCAQTSNIHVSHPNIADGVTPTEVTLKIKTSNNEPIIGFTAQIFVSGDQNFIVPCSKSDVNGIAKCRIYSTKAEKKIITMQGDVSYEVSVVFSAKQERRNTVTWMPVGGSETLLRGQRTIATTGTRSFDTRMMDALNISQERPHMQGVQIEK